MTLRALAIALLSLLFLVPAFADDEPLPAPATICGIGCDATTEALVKRLGKPTKHFENPNTHWIVDTWKSAGDHLTIQITWEPGHTQFTELSVWLDDDVYTDIQETLKAKGLDDPLLALLNQPIASTIDQYGLPDEETTQWIRYALPDCPGSLAFDFYGGETMQGLRLMVEPGKIPLRPGTAATPVAPAGS